MPDDVAQARELIRDHYREKGYAFIQIELRITAASAVEARRALVEFLGGHDGSDWSLTAVARELVGHVSESFSDSTLSVATLLHIAMSFAEAYTLTPPAK